MKRKNKILLEAINLIGTQAQTAEFLGVAISALNDATRFKRRIPVFAVIHLSMAIQFKYMPWEIDPTRDWSILKEFCETMGDLIKY